MAKRSYHRRTDEELIAELQAKINAVEERVKAKTRTDADVLKQLPKIGRNLNKFAQLAMDHGRADLSNMTIAFLAGLQRAAEDTPEASNTTPRGRRENSVA
jgi:small-conductance mechanosensitive channel